MQLSKNLQGGGHLRSLQELQVLATEFQVCRSRLREKDHKCTSAPLEVKLALERVKCELCANRLACLLKFKAFVLRSNKFLTFSKLDERKYGSECQDARSNNFSNIV